MKVLGVVGASVLAILIVVLVAVGGYQLHWWLRGQEVNRSAQINYHEGYVSTVSGPAHWDTVKGEIVMDGASSADFTVGK